MQIAVELPEDIADILRRRGAFSHAEAFLKKCQTYLEFDNEDFERDRRSLDGIPSLRTRSC